MSNIIVLAGGPSVRGFNLRGLETRGLLIAVNDAAIYTKCRFAVSLCPRWIKNRLELLGQLGVPYAWLEESGRPTMPPKVVTRTSMTEVTWFETDLETTIVSYGPAKLAGDNSGHAAVNLALRLADPGDKLYVLGMDMKPGAAGHYWYPNYPWAQTADQAQDAKYSPWRTSFGWLASECRAAGFPLHMVGLDEPVPDTIHMSFKDFRLQA